MSWLEVAWEGARAIYSLGLLAVGAAVLAGTPSTVRVLRDLTAALAVTAKGLQATVADRDTLDKIQAAVDRVEATQQVDRAELAQIRMLLERLLRAQKAV